MNDQNKASPLNSSFFTHFYNEELYIIKEKTQASPFHNEGGKPAITQVLPGNAKPEIIINGKQDSDLLIMFENPKAGGMNAQDREFFINILKAAGRKPADVAAINTANIKGVNWEDISAVSRSGLVIAFGVPAEMLPPGFSLGEIFEADGKKILAIDALTVVAADKEKKRILWQGMQKLFNL